MEISKNIEIIYKKIKEVDRENIVLVAVSKRRLATQIDNLFGLGIKNIAENYVNEALEKFKNLHHPFKKHFIGPIQSNKIKKIVKNFDLIQSVDKIKTAKLINFEANKLKKIMPILIQINISDEKSKSGIPKKDLKKFVSEIYKLKNLKILGLMSIGTSGSREEFREMKILFDSLNREGFDLKFLSMGMTHDFVMAIEEGSNMIRIGRGIFEGD